MHTPILCLVTDRRACLGRPVEDVVAAALTAGVTMIQLREKDLCARDLLALGRRLQETVRTAGAALVVNDRLDVALALGAEGVHLSAGGLPVREVRRLVEDRTLIGVSAHTLDEALRAEAEGADYVVLGTIFETRSHPGVAPAGPGLLAGVAAVVRIPVVAIGGINRHNAPTVMAAGASGVAVIRAIQSAADVVAATRELLESIGKPREPGGRQGNSEDTPFAR